MKTVLTLACLFPSLFLFASAQGQQTNNATADLNQQGTDLYMAGRFNEAIQFFDQALAINPNDTYASDTKNLALAQIQLQQQQAPQQAPQPVQQQEQQTVNIPPHEAVDGFVANGKINSDIVTATSKWDAAGDWSMVVNNNELVRFTTNMTWNNATSGHTHEFSGFESEGDGDIVLPPDNIVSIRGTMDVGTNRVVTWEDVPATIDIGGGGKVISIALDHEGTDHHFAGQAVRGVVTLLTPCSDTPGASMEVLPACGTAAPDDEDDEDDDDADAEQEEDEEDED